MLDHTALTVAMGTSAKTADGDTITDSEHDGHFHFNEPLVGADDSAPAGARHQPLQGAQQISWLGDRNTTPIGGKEPSRHGRVLARATAAVGRRQQGAGTHADTGLGQSAPLDAAALALPQWVTTLPHGDGASDGASR